MSKKKNQHIIPKCYLKEFEGIEKPSKEYKSFVWLSIKAERLQWIPNGIVNRPFAESYFYNDGQIFSNNPIVENRLSTIENNYSKIIKKIKKKKFLNSKEWKQLEIFLNSLFLRTKKIQTQANDIVKRISEMIGYFDKEKGEKFYSENKENGKHILLNDLVFRNSFELKTFVLINKSNEPFLSSDSPIFNMVFYENELLEYFPMIKTNREYIKYTTMGGPLAPDVYIIYSPYFDNNVNDFFIIEDDILIAKINTLQIQNAQTFLFSNKRKFIFDYEGIIKKMNESFGKKVFRCFTENNKFVFSMLEVEKIGLASFFVTIEKRDFNIQWFTDTQFFKVEVQDESGELVCTLPMIEIENVSNGIVKMKVYSRLPFLN